MKNIKFLQLIVAIPISHFFNATLGLAKGAPRPGWTAGIQGLNEKDSCALQ